MIRLIGPIGSGQRMKVLLTFANGRIANMAIETGQMFGFEPYATSTFCVQVALGIIPMVVSMVRSASCSRSLIN